MHLDSLLVALYTMVDDWFKENRRSPTRCGPTAGKRQLIKGMIWQLKEYFGLERHRAKP